MGFESWTIFKVAKKRLPPGKLQSIYRRSTRLVDLWAANPAHCEVTARNPMDHMRMLLDALDNAGCEDHAVAGANYMLEPLEMHAVPLTSEPSDRGDVDGELADLFAAGGRLASRIRDALADGQLDTAERIAIHEMARRIVKELNQVLDAAGMKGVSHVG